MSLPTLTVIIPVCNGAVSLAQCLNAVVRASSRPQVIVVDDGSRDGSAEIAAGFPCTVLRLGTNRGAAAARNEGAHEAQGDVLFFLDSDVLIEPDTFARIARLFEAHPDLDALFGSYQGDTVPRNFVSQYKNLLHHYTHQNARPAAATFCAGYGAVRRSVFDELGGFDETNRALEDIDFGYRMHAAGHTIRLEKDLYFTHLKHYSLAGLVRSDLFNRAIPWTRLMLKHSIVRNDLNTKIHNVLSVCVAFLLLVLPLAGVFTPRLWPVWLVLWLLLIALNTPFLAFVRRERGAWFAARTVAMSWFFYFYSGIGLLLGVAAHAFAWRRR